MDFKHIHPALMSIAVFVLLIVSGNSVLAKMPQSNEVIVLASNAVSLAQAVENIRQQTGGRILSAKKTGNGKLYVIKVLMPNGQVRTFRVDAATGANR